MYGNFNNYFHSGNTQFHNSIWIELIGFEKNAPDYGVQDYLDTIGFVPDSVSLHLTSVDFVNTHSGMDMEYVLPPYACSYNGHAQNDQRARQDWTNYDLRGLVGTLQARGIQVFASFFDLISQTDTRFTDAHPELLASGADTAEQGIMMIKRFADGTYYEDFLLTKLLAVAADYGFDGVQLADGISSPRNAIWFADFSQDILKQSGLDIPGDATDIPGFIRQHRRREWIAFYRKRWGAFLTKIIKGLKQAGIAVAVNSAWTRDPFEAIYRYGVDYKAIEDAGADYFVVEDVSADLAILGYEDNHNYALSYAERKMIHYEFVANLMAICAHNTKMRITPLFMIWDNQEQWDVLHHAPTAMQRAAAANFTHFYLKNGALSPITDGPHFCLGDALGVEDWKFIRLCIDNGYTPKAVDAEGATFIWSRRRMENELESFIRHGVYHSAKWLALLLRQGAAIQKIACISQLHELSGDIAVANYSLLPPDEQAAVDGYTNGKIIKFETHAKADAECQCTPKAPGWPRPLDFSSVPETYIADIVRQINAEINASFKTAGEECTLHEVLTGENTANIIVENNEYYYVIPKIETKRRIRQIKFLTKPDGYPLRCTEHTFQVRVAGRGVEIAEIQYWPDI